ncbi:MULTISPECIES: hypothetical protein [unclassified Burkholderia]|uniref:hypothetical protein n=1 Tax=unclassified Burkholderia TaxID=2613784 RepID=UPI0012E361B3|nr:MULTISPECIES: hypothetical protein [unclassified Burkholderia]
MRKFTESLIRPFGKRTKAVPLSLGDCDVLTLLQDVALDRVEATAVEVRAATAIALPLREDR